MSTLDPAAILSSWVAIPSPSGEEGAAADFAVDLCGRLGLDCERVGDSVIARPGRTGRSEDPGGPRLLFASHLDTVPAGAGWTGDPFDGTWRDGRLVARGACDAKASATAMLWAAAHAGDALEGELVVAITAGEETRNAGMAAVLEHLGTPDAAVVGEPTGLAVVRAQAGLCVLEASWSGRSCHAAHVARVPSENALTAAARDLAAFGSWQALPGEHPLLGAGTVAATQLAAGERHNVVPDRAVAVLDARVPPPWDGPRCREFVASALPGAEVTVRSDRLRPVETPADHPLVRAALAAAGAPAAVGSSTLSDMALLHGVPAVKCGPGETARSHTPDEFVLEAELLAGCDFYTALAPAALRALRGARPVTA